MFQWSSLAAFAMQQQSVIHQPAVARHERRLILHELRQHI